MDNTVANRSWMQLRYKFQSIKPMVIGPLLRINFVYKIILFSLFNKLSAQRFSNGWKVRNTVFKPKFGWIFSGNMKNQWILYLSYTLGYSGIWMWIYLYNKCWITFTGQYAIENSKYYIAVCDVCVWWHRLHNSLTNIKCYIVHVPFVSDYNL